MKYQEAIDYLYSRLPVYQRQGASAMKKDLTNIRGLCEHLGDPHRAYPSIHVAGTNGKGTVTHLIASMLQTAGLRVGLYTSPHYTDFRERIKINGQWISEQRVIDFVSDHRGVIEDVEPSFFEVTVAMAFDYFRQEQVDIAVIETGLGGRLDSTNIVTPELSVITHISMDHTAILGDTIYAIAGEKAGIIKPNTPVVIGRYQSSCDHVFGQRARQLGAPLSYADRAWTYRSGRLLGPDEITIDIDTDLSMESPFLLENIITGVHSVHTYTRDHQLDIDYAEAIRSYRELTSYIGRWQVLQHSPTIIADSAHNPDAIHKVLRRLSQMEYKHLHMVLGFVSDKDVQKVLTMMPKDATYYWVQPSIFRALDSKKLADQGASHQLIGEHYHSISSGVEAAKNAANRKDLIYIGGSSFVVGDLLHDLIVAQ